MLDLYSYFITYMGYWRTHFTEFDILRILSIIFRLLPFLIDPQNYAIYFGCCITLLPPCKGSPEASALWEPIACLQKAFSQVLNGGNCYIDILKLSTSDIKVWIVYY